MIGVIFDNNDKIKLKQNENFTKRNIIFNSYRQQ